MRRPPTDDPARAVPPRLRALRGAMDSRERDELSPGSMPSSGRGRELSAWALGAFAETKTIVFDISCPGTLP